MSISLKGAAREQVSVSVGGGAAGSVTQTKTARADAPISEEGLTSLIGAKNSPETVQIAEQLRDRLRSSGLATRYSPAEILYGVEVEGDFISLVHLASKNVYFLIPIRAARALREELFVHCKRKINSVADFYQPSTVDDASKSSILNPQYAVLKNKVEGFVEAVTEIAETIESAMAGRYRTVREDSATALLWYRRGAELGDPEAQNNFGSMLLNGTGCEKDPTQAAYWYRRSAEQGNSVAQWNLAKRYLHGDGVDQDYAEAYSWFREALSQGYTNAACEMGTMHWLGHGVERNLLAAAEFHLIAAEDGDSVAARNLSEYRPELERLALAGNQMASLFLCRMYNSGSGAEKSPSLTWAWILLAHKYCVPDINEQIAAEVNRAYGFYRQCITPANRKAGRQAIKLLREVYSERTSTLQGSSLKHANASVAGRRSAARRETVLKVGCDGGSLTLFRKRSASNVWQFWVERNETALYELLLQEDRDGFGEYFSKTGYVRSFREAMSQLESYSWFRLYPLEVHPEFFNAVLVEVEKRGGAHEATRWREELKR